MSETQNVDDSAFANDTELELFGSHADLIFDIVEPETAIETFHSHSTEGERSLTEVILGSCLIFSGEIGSSSTCEPSLHTLVLSDCNRSLGLISQIARCQTFSCDHDRQAGLSLAREGVDLVSRLSKSEQLRTIDPYMMPYFITVRIRELRTTSNPSGWGRLLSILCLRDRQRTRPVSGTYAWHIRDSKP